jgi:carboxyl-terminal processing protease
MMIRKAALLLLCLIGQAWAQTPLLKTSDIRPSMEQMFAYHVECKELSPLLVRRSFKLYIEQFDPDKMYLLDEEVKPFLELKDSQISDVVRGYYQDQFTAFFKLNQLMAKSIQRARAMRREIEKELVSNPGSPSSVAPESYQKYASTEAQLGQRMRKQLGRFLAAEYHTSATASWTPERREKIFTLLERRIARMEESYLVQDAKGRPLNAQGMHYISLHILKAMGKSLDAHTSFFRPEVAYEMRLSLEKQFEGIGVILKEGVDGVAIVGLIRGGPAARCQEISLGDILVGVDGVSVEGASYEEVLAAMKGTGSKEIVLGLKRRQAEGDARLQVKLVREKITMQDERLQYSSEPFGEGIIGKLVLPSFYESGDESNCEKDMREAIRELKKQGQLLGVVLDMRENSGGFLNQAVKVAGLFITSGVIVISKYSHGEIQYLRDIDGRVYFNGPMVILTSKASASAAEIVAQALQDYGTAIIAGDERTYGKGTIQYQTVTDEQAETFFKVTVGKYYTVSGKSTQIEGVKADVLVPTPYSVYNIGERFLEYPLANDQVPPAYIDPLADIDQQSKLWFQKNYLPMLQQRESQWRKMLPTLKANSSYRLSHDKDFTLFLDSLHQSSKEPLYERPSNWGSEDLQMKEAVHIVQDMILLTPR